MRLYVTPRLGMVILSAFLGASGQAVAQPPPGSAGESAAKHLFQIVHGASARPGRAQVPRPGWRAPDIEAAVRAAGQRIIERRVVAVPAAAPWIDTGLPLAAGERLWTDTRVDGVWSGNPRYFPFSDAEGLPVYPGAYRIDADAPVESLIGFVGPAPPKVHEVSVAAGTKAGGSGGTTDPGFLLLGDSLMDFRPRTRGTIWLRNNDNTNQISDVGKQIVKVILAVPAS